MTKAQMQTAINAANFAAADTANLIATKTNIKFLQDSLTWLHVNTSSAAVVLLGAIQLTNSKLNDSLSNHLGLITTTSRRVDTANTAILAARTMAIDSLRDHLDYIELLQYKGTIYENWINALYDTVAAMKADTLLPYGVNWTGTGAPSTSLGKNGDSYWDTVGLIEYRKFADIWRQQL